jgi:molecular chaperone GrpE
MPIMSNKKSKNKKNDTPQDTILEDGGAAELNGATTEAATDELDPTTILEGKHEQLDPTTILEGENGELDPTAVLEGEHDELDPTTILEGERDELDPTAILKGQPDESDPIAVLEGERDKLKDQVLRAAAEVENMRRRTERELSQARKYGHSSFARDLLSVIENMKRAVDVLPEDRAGLDEAMTNLVIGVEMINQEIGTVLEKHGVQVIDPMGEKFDYEKHQAMFEVPTDEVEPGTVMQVAQRGWMLHDRLLTPAMVGVSKPADDDKTDK